MKEIMIVLYIDNLDKKLLSPSLLKKLNILCKNYWKPIENTNYIYRYSSGSMYILPQNCENDVEEIYNFIKKNQKFHTNNTFISYLIKIT